MDRIFKFDLDGEVVGVKQNDLPAFKAEGHLARAVALRPFEVGGEVSYVRSTDIDKFRAENAQAPEMVELHDGTDTPTYVRRKDREAFIKQLSGDERVKVARQLLPTSKYAKNTQSVAKAFVRGAGEGLVRGARDLGVTAAKAVVSVPEMIAGAADIATAPRAPSLGFQIMTAATDRVVRPNADPAERVSWSDIPTGFVGKGLERAGVDFENTKQAISSLGSPEQQAANKAVSDAKGIVGTVKAYAKNPTVAVHQTLESIPSMAIGATIAPGIAAEGIPTALAGAAGEGIVTAAQMQEQIRQQQESGLTTPSQTAAAVGAGAMTAAIGAGSGKIANKLGIVDPETLAAGGMKAAPNSPGVIRRVASGIAQEGTEENLQSMQEQAMQNLATGRPVGEGVKEAGVSGQIVGGVMSAGANVVRPATVVTEGTKEVPPIPDYVPPQAPVFPEAGSAIPTPEAPVNPQASGSATLVVNPDIPANTSAYLDKAAGRSVEPVKPLGIAVRRLLADIAIAKTPQPDATPKQISSGSGNVETLPPAPEASPEPEKVEASKRPTKISETGKALEEILYKDRPTVDVPINDVQVQSPGFEQFKQDANPKTGEVAGQELKGRVVDLDAKPIVVVQRLDGSKVVVTGRHRLGLYKRNGRETIPAKVLYESEGVTPDVAHAIDAISNILDEKGTINDYVRFFDDSQISDEEAQSLLDRPSAKSAYSIHRDSSQVTRDAVDWDGEGKGGISAEQAAIISRNAPISQNQGFAGAQVLGVKAARNGMKGKLLDGYMQAIVRNELIRQRNKAAGPAPEPMDLFAGTQWDVGDAESIAAKEAKYTSGKASEYATLRSVLSAALKKSGRLVLTDSQASDLGITDKADKAQIEAAWKRSAALADYWAKGNLEVDDIIKMRQSLGLSTEGLSGSQESFRVSESAPDMFSLEQVSGDQIGNEARAAAQRAEMERRQKHELDGSGSAGMDQPGLPGIETDTPLFNQQKELFNVAESTPEMFAPGSAGRGGNPATGGGMRDAAQGAAGGKLDGKPRLGMMEADLVEFATALLGGKLPRVVKKLRGLNGMAAGAFRVSEDGKVSIDIRADQALVVSNKERLEILRKAQQITELEMGVDAAGTDEVAFATRRKQLIKQMLNEAFSRNIVRNRPALLRVLAHEAAHALDFMPDGTLKRGNIFGHIAALSNYTKKSMGMDPSSPGPLTEDEKKEMMKRARREVGQGKERVIIEEIVREIPEYKIVGVKPSDVTSLLGTEAGKATPELYAWFAAQDTQTKKEILKAAIKGAVDSRLDQFGKKVQTGIRIEKETKTTTFKPTEEDVRKRFRELLKEEVTARRLAELAVVKKELEGLIAWYNNAEEMPEYYQEPAEMFAEAFSAWLNYPGEVETRAPVFNSMMEGWIAERPEAYKEYQAIQKKLAVPQESNNERWNEFERGTKAVTIRTIAAADNAERWSRGERRDQLSAFWLRRMNPVYARVWKLEDKMQAGNTVLALAKMRLSGAAQEILTGLWGARVIGPLRRAGVDTERFNGYLFARRVAKEGVETMVNDARDGGRANLANPIGANAASAEARLAELRKSMGEEKYGAMEKAAEEMWKIRQEDLFPVLRETGVFTPEQYEMIAENWAYAKFATDRTGEMTELQKMMSGSFGPGSGIHAQHGTFQQIGGPAENTLMADISMWQWARAQDAKRKALLAIAKVDPQMIEPAEFTVVNGRRVYRDVDTPRVKTIYYTHQGKLSAFNVPTSIAQALGRTTEGTGEVVNKSAAWIIQAQAQVLTTHNIGFWFRNPPRDISDASKLLPSPRWFTLPWVGNPLLEKEILNNFKSSARREFRILDEHTLEGLRRGMLVPEGSFSADTVYEKDSLARELRKAGIKTPQAALSASKRAAETVWDVWGKISGVFHTSETAVKLGSMDYLDKYYPDMPEWEKQWKVEKLGGTPAVLEHSNFGSMPAARIFVMYYNINKEAMLNHIEAFKERPGEYVFKTAVGTIPQIIQYGAIYGMFSALFRFLADSVGGGDDDSEEDKAKAARFNAVADEWADWEEMQKSIPFRDRMLYNSLAFSWDDKKNGKVAYFRFMDSPIAGAQRALMFGGIDAAAGRISWKQMFSIGVGDQLPNTSPVMATIFAAATGYDPSFGFREFVDPAAPAGVKLQEFGKLAWNNMTGGGLGLYRMRQDPRLGDPEPGQIEAWLQKPGVSQVVRSFVRVSNSGIKDEMRVEDMMMKRTDYTESTAMDEVVAAHMAGRNSVPAALEVVNSMMPDRRERLLAERIGKLSLKDMDIWKRRAYELPDAEQELRSKAIRRSEALGK